MIAALVAVSFADGGGTNAGAKYSSRSRSAISKKPDTGLLGINLYDPGLRVLNVFGEPNEVTTVGGGVAASGGRGGGGGAPGGRGPGGGGGAPGGGRAGGTGGGGSTNAVSEQTGPINPGSELFGGFDLLQGGPPPGSFSGPPVPGPQGPGGGAPRPQGTSGAGGGPGSLPGLGSPAGDGGDRIIYTRWVYRRGPSRYSFVFNKQNLVLQIEAVGSNDGRVHTSQGIRFGSTFGDVIKRYGAPDAYEINGSSIVCRYLVNKRVAFRLNQLDPKKPYVVTGVVVAAGKA